VRITSVSAIVVREEVGKARCVGVGRACVLISSFWDCFK
jgi:hypothetical protein